MLTFSPNILKPWLSTFCAMILCHTSIADESIWTRDRLTGDWGGIRTDIEDKGITFQANYTSFYQGVASGDTSGDFEYGSKASGFLLFDFEKLANLTGWKFLITGDYNIGQSINGEGDTIFPVNNALFYPGIDDSERVDASYYLAKTFNEGAHTFFIGKIDMFEISNFSPYHGGSGIFSFENSAFVAPIDGITPANAAGGFYLYASDALNITLGVYGSQDTTNELFPFDDAFDDGTIFMFNGDIPFTLFNKTGRQGLAVIFSDKDSPDLSSFIRNSELGLEPDIKEDSYSFGYYFDYALYKDTNDDNNSYGLFGQAYITDQDATPFEWLAVLGVGGSAPFFNRTQDRWGIALSYAAPIDELDNLANPINGGRTGDETAIEAFYDYYPAPWLSLGPDLQWAESGLTGEKSFFTGLKLRIAF